MSHYQRADPLARGQPGVLGKLTAREREVAALIAQGFTNDEIAQRLVLTTGTVANHVAHILGKLNVTSRVLVAVKFAPDRTTRSAAEVLMLLGCLQEVGRTDLAGALQHATDILASVFTADKVDAFLYEPAVELLVALGTSRTELGRRQRQGAAPCPYLSRRPCRLGVSGEASVLRRAC
jgi:DNA-binding CsgD family transcriptional regulator